MYSRKRFWKINYLYSKNSIKFFFYKLEAIKGSDCFKIETKSIKTINYPIFHDDLHGTVCAVLARLINAK